ncbi:beta-microseminoprotein J1-like [Notothenia coriiceps]|uniref:Beta-microseminoprotein J1-like n=1 Tax=Notothenia coriiceps TaxID=8208 RepID=A0A6I9P7D3_9TELE|nr:PREDICTED: beta-microseminoprotein J1-like [Notothenia coriiceps]
MKCLALASLLCALVSLSDSCLMPYVEPRERITHCQDNADKTWHPVGSRWRNSKCIDCTCNSCCPVYATPTVPDDCESVLDLKACEYIVHKKNDSTVECHMYGMLKEPCLEISCSYWQG